jgi:hypothetical protein
MDLERFYARHRQRDAALRPPPPVIAPYSGLVPGGGTCVRRRGRLVRPRRRDGSSPRGPARAPRGRRASARPYAFGIDPLQGGVGGEVAVVGGPGPVRVTARPVSAWASRMRRQRSASVVMGFSVTASQPACSAATMYSSSWLRRMTMVCGWWAGLLGQFAIWTAVAVALHARIRGLVVSGEPIPAELLRIGAQLTDANAAVFDAANGFRGCIPGIHDVLCREGVLAGRWCLDPDERLSQGQQAEIDRVWRAYPHLREPDLLDGLATSDR